MATGAISAGTIGFSLRRVRDDLADRQIPLAGVSAAFVFAAQMVNFPVAAGTTGHLLGGALAAILLGPATGALVVAVVVAVQALVFADGGLTALGYNVLNMAVVTSFGGWGAFRLARRFLPSNGSGVVVAAGFAAGISVVLSAAAFSLEWLFGASAPVPFDTVFGAMVGVHTLIGVGEAVVTAIVVGAVLAARPDLVEGAADLDRAALSTRPALHGRAAVLSAAVVTVLVATVASQFSGAAPDGLERVARDTGIAPSAREHDLADTLFADYATEGLRDDRASLAVAGITGVVIVAAVGTGLVAAARPRRSRPASSAGVG